MVKTYILQKDYYINFVFPNGEVGVYKRRAGDKITGTVNLSTGFLSTMPAPNVTVNVPLVLLSEDVKKTTDTKTDNGKTKFTFIKDFQKGLDGGLSFSKGDVIEGISKTDGSVDYTYIPRGVTGFPVTENIPAEYFAEPTKEIVAKEGGTKEWYKNLIPNDSTRGIVTGGLCVIGTLVVLKIFKVI